MMMLPEVRMRPGIETGAHLNLNLTRGDQPSGSLEIVDPLDAIARHVDGTFVLVVKLTAGRYRRRCFLTARSAENAALRATQRGENATVYLAELKPLWKLQGGGAS